MSPDLTSGENKAEIDVIVKFISSLLFNCETIIIISY